MDLRHKLLLLCFMLGACRAPAACAQDFAVGYFELPPHAMRATPDQPQGLAIEYFRHIAGRMGLEHVTFNQYPLPRLLKMLEEGHLQMILIMGKTAERETRFHYPSSPMLTTSPVLAMLKQHPLQQIRGIEDLLPLKIGVWQEGYFSPLLRNKQLHLAPLSGDQVVLKGLRMIVAGRIDGFYFPDIYSAKSEARKYGLLGQLKILPLPEQPVELYSIFSKSSAVANAPAYERALRQLQSEQPYQQLLEQRLAD
ncbi:MAG: substrate-binding periplasmic protein [Pseudomonas sp.]